MCSRHGLFSKDPVECKISYDVHVCFVSAHVPVGWSKIVCAHGALDLVVSVMEEVKWFGGNGIKSLCQLIVDCLLKYLGVVFPADNLCY